MSQDARRTANTRRWGTVAGFGATVGAMLAVAMIPTAPSAHATDDFETELQDILAGVDLDNAGPFELFSVGAALEVNYFINEIIGPNVRGFEEITTDILNTANSVFITLDMGFGEAADALFGGDYADAISDIGQALVQAAEFDLKDGIRQIAMDIGHVISDDITHPIVAIADPLSDFSEITDLF